MVKGENERELQELSNKVISYLDTRFKIAQTFGADFDLDKIEIADAETNDLNKEEVIEGSGVTMKFCDAEYNKIDKSEFKLRQGK